jgi:hypothetical protein
MFQPGKMLAFTLLAVLCIAPRSVANTILDTSAPANLGLFNLGTVPDVAATYGNQIFYEGLAIVGNNLLLSVGDPATANQKVWSLPLMRVNNHIVGFGSASVYDPTLAYPGNCCVGNVMSGGLVPVGNSTDLLYTTQFFSYLGQHTGGNPGTNTMIDLATTGATAGGLNYVPNSFTSNGAGKLKLSSTCEPGSFGCSAQGDFYTLNLAGSTLASYTAYTVGVSALSFDYVPADATFTAPGIVLGDASQLRLDYYQVDGNGNPCNPTVNISCGPIVHLVVSDNVQIGLGVVRDPVTGDILFTSGDNHIYEVTENLPEPGSIVLVLGGLALVFKFRKPSNTDTPQTGD